jgi:hypothetical protein
MGFDLDLLPYSTHAPLVTDKHPNHQVKYASTQGNDPESS